MSAYRDLARCQCIYFVYNNNKSSNNNSIFFSFCVWVNVFVCFLFNLEIKIANIYMKKVPSSTISFSFHLSE